ncbi:MAG: class I SAM-dependent methyltransferase [Armatimonadota bacterium]|nr:class I SAM-dependent methyltransferase [Armatimonadota bacterium]
MSQTQRRSPAWWREFFESADCIPLSFFPGEEETRRQVQGLRQLLELSAGERIADVCCGMGRHAIPLAEGGATVVGVDVSALMLRIAETLAEDTDGLHLVQGDAARLPLRSSCMDVVLNLFNSFGYFEDERQNARVLEEARRCLRPGGRFLLETRNRAYQILYAPYYQEVELADGSPAVIRCRYDEGSHRLSSRWTDPDDPDEILYRASIRLYDLDELREMFHAAGLQIEGVFGQYDGRPFEGWERMLILLAHKR